MAAKGTCEYCKTHLHTRIPMGNHAITDCIFTSNTKSPAYPMVTVLADDQDETRSYVHLHGAVILPADEVYLTRSIWGAIRWHLKMRKRKPQGITTRTR